MSDVDTEEYQEDSLDQLLSDSSSDTEKEAQPEPTKEPEAPVEQAEAEKEVQQEESEGDKEDSTPESGSDFNDREKALYATGKAEREKRQALEEEVKTEREGRQALEKEIAEYKRSESGGDSPAEDSIKDVDPLDDPVAWAENIRQQARFETSQIIAREKHSDYDEKEAIFLDLVKDNSALRSQVLKSSNPAQFAYETAVNHERFSKFNSFDEAVSKEIEKRESDIEKSIREKLEKEYEAKLKKANSLPPSGADTGSLGSDQAALGHDSLQDILGEKN